VSVVVNRFAFPSPAVLTLGVAVCLLPGCVVGPDYVKPTIDTPLEYRFAEDDRAASPATDTRGWWQGFGDAELDALVVEGLRSNHDLRIAALRVDEFAAQAIAVRSAGLPQVGYGSSVARQVMSDSRLDESHSALLSASWELDLWGRIRRETEAARANLLATEEARIGVGLSVASAIVSGYLTLLDLDRRLQIAESTVEGRRRTVELFQMRLDGGAVSDFEMMQVTAEYETAVAAVPDLKRAIDQQENALSLLLGRNPGPIRRGVTLETLAVPSVPAGLPSDLLERRPDILQSEQQLVAANAMVGVARALYFPRLSLTGSAGSVSDELDDLFSGPARTWSFVGQLLGPIFNGGAIDAANRQAEARREQAVASYSKTIQSAFRDVEDALASLSANRLLVASYERRVQSLEKAVGLSVERYDNGYADYLEVLDTERSLFSAKLSMTAVRGDSLRNLTDLYLALGGDWTQAAEAAPAPPPQVPVSDAGAIPQPPTPPGPWLSSRASHDESD
jgi:multidrug efflux system outer membrane protein